jgi:hypothetical protein
MYYKIANNNFRNLSNLKKSVVTHWIIKPYVSATSVHAKSGDFASYAWIAPADGQYATEIPYI